MSATRSMPSASSTTSRRTSSCSWISGRRLKVGLPTLRRSRRSSSEAFMPLAFGGGIRSLETAHRTHPGRRREGRRQCTRRRATRRLSADIADRLGTSTLVVGIDALRTAGGGYEAVTRNGTRRSGMDVRRRAEAAVGLGAGEIFLNSIDLDGTMGGYDLELIRLVTSAVGIPVIACGGAGVLSDLAAAVTQGGASAAAAGSLFVFHGRHRAVLITYPSYSDRVALLRYVRGCAPICGWLVRSAVRTSPDRRSGGRSRTRHAISAARP